MLYSFDLRETTITLFVVVNWILSISSGAAFVFIYFRQRFLLIKPSMITFGVAHLLFQWPLTVYAGYYETWLPHPYEVVVVVHGFVVVGLIGGVLMFRGSAETAWDVLSKNVNAHGRRRIAIVALFLLTGAVTAVYLSYVPLTCTGLYALVVDPANAAIAREMSLKLLADPIPRYGLTLLSSSIVPLLTALVATELLTDRTGGFLLRTSIYVPLLAVAWLAADLTGAKGILVSLSLVVVSTILWRQQLRTSILMLPVMLGLALVPAYMITFLISLGVPSDGAKQATACFSMLDIDEVKAGNEQGIITAFAKDKSPSRSANTLKEALTTLEKMSAEQPSPQQAEASHESVFRRIRDQWDQIRDLAAVQFVRARVFALKLMLQTSYYAETGWAQLQAVLNRAVVVPLEVGVWYVHYGQTHEPMGIGAVPRIARALGTEIIDGPNVIGRTYGPLYYGHEVPPTISAGAGFIFSYFAYFGKWSIPVNLMLVWLTDIVILFYRFINKVLLLPTVAAMTLANLKFLESDYSAVWLTHGFGVILLLSLILTLITGWWPRAGQIASVRTS
jgi:hypothetical protein